MLMFSRHLLNTQLLQNSSQLALPSLVERHHQFRILHSGDNTLLHPHRQIQLRIAAKLHQRRTGPRRAESVCPAPPAAPDVGQQGGMKNLASDRNTLGNSYCLKTRTRGGKNTTFSRPLEPPEPSEKRCLLKVHVLNHQD